MDWDLALCVLASKAVMFLLGALAGLGVSRLDGAGRGRARAAAYGLAATCSNDMGVGRPVRGGCPAQFVPRIFGSFSEAPRLRDSDGCGRI